jgi:Clr5 domain
MDIPYNSAFVLAGASALPSTSSFHHAQIHETLHLQHQKVQESIPVQGLSVVAGGKREISNQQWEEMKPLIQRVYIKENKPFRHLKNILRTEYGVEPTYGFLPYYSVVDIISLESD